MDQSENQPEQPNISEPTIQPEIPQKPKSPTWMIVLITVLAIAIVGGGGYAAYQYYSTLDEPVACTEDAKVCPDGSAVGRTGPDCEFAECPEVIDPTADWQTYRNEEYGFEAKYPEGWELEKSSNSFNLVNKDEKYVSGMGSISAVPITPIIITIKNDIYKSSIDAYLTNDQMKKILKDETVLINEGKAYVVKGITPPTCHDSRIIFINNKVYHISSNACLIRTENQDNGDEVDKIFNQILSTFKFIEADETTNWQTYRNEEYGFEVRYPEGWLYTNQTQPVTGIVFKSQEEQAYQEEQKRIGGGAFPTDSISIGIQNNENGLGTKEWIEEKYSIVSEISEIEVDNKRGLEAIISGHFEDKIVFIPKDKKMYTFWRSYNSNYVETFNQILSTFKFIE